MTTPTNTPSGPTTPGGPSPEQPTRRTSGPSSRGRTKTPFERTKKRLKDKQAYKDVYGDKSKHKHVLDFHDQCFLVDFMSEFVKLKGSGRESLLWAPRHVAEVKDSNSPQSKTFLSEISHDAGQAFFDRGAPVGDIWNIRPNITLYKIFYEPNGKEVKVKFPVKSEIDAQITLGARSDGRLYSNIEEFSFNYEGVNPAEVDYSITAELRMYFNHADALFKKFRGRGSDGKTYRLSFADLIRRPTWRKEAPISAADSNDGYRDWNEKFFRIWVEIDYDVDALTKEERAKYIKFYYSLKQQKIGFFLNILKHEIDIEDSPGMPFYLNIDYIAAVEGAMNNREYADILGNKLLPSAMTAAQSPTATRFRAIKRAMRGRLGFPGVIEQTDEEQDKFFSELFKGQEVRLGRHRNSPTQVVFFDPDIIIGDLSYGQDRSYRKDNMKTLPKSSEDLMYVFHNGHINLMSAEVANAELGDEAKIMTPARAVQKQYLKNATERLAKEREAKDLATLGAPDRVKAILLAHEYDELRKEYKRLMDNSTLPREERYVLLIDELFGNLTTGWEDEDTREKILKDRSEGSSVNPSQHGGPAINADIRAMAARRVYEVKIPGTQMHNYITKKTEMKKNIGNRLESLRNRAEAGDKTAQRELQNYRIEQTKRSQQNLSNFWKTFKSRFKNTGGGITFSPLIIKPNQIDLQKDPGSEATAYRFELLEKIASDRQNATGNETNPGESGVLGKSHKPIKGEFYHLQWMYLGDIVDAALTIVKFQQEKLGIQLPNYLFWTQAPSKTGLASKKTPPNQPKFVSDPSYKPVFGNLSYDDPMTGDLKTISMAKIPVSLKLFNEFWTEFVVDPQIDHYPFQQFVKDICTYVIENCFTSRCSSPGDMKNNIKASYSIISQDKRTPNKVHIAPGPGFTHNDFCPKASIGQTQRMHVARHLLTPKDSAEGVLYIFCTTNNLHHLEKKQGERLINLHKKNNIMHIELGKLTGDNAPGVRSSPIQSISFSKADVPYYLESKGQQAGLAADTLELSEPYNVNLKIFGNMAFKPGVHFYLMLPYLGADPLYERIPSTNTLRPAGRNSKAAKLGLGGYFMVTKCKNTISALDQRYDWVTDVSALWVGYPIKAGKADPVYPLERSAEQSTALASVNKWLTENAKILTETLENAEEVYLQGPEDEVRTATDYLNQTTNPGG